MKNIKSKFKALLDCLGKVRFLTMYYWILAITILLFVGSLSVTNAIAKKGVKREYQEYNESLFKQAQAEMERSIQELIQIAYNIMSDREVNAYLNTKSLSERSRLLEEVIRPEFSSIQAIKSSIETISLYDQSDEIGYIYPDMTIRCLESGNLKIQNSMEDDRNFYLANVESGEIITLHGEEQIIESNRSSHNIYDDFNFKFPRICNTYENKNNVLTFSIPIECTLTYSPIRKVGI